MNPKGKCKSCDKACKECNEESDQCLSCAKEYFKVPGCDECVEGYEKKGKNCKLVSEDNENENDRDLEEDNEEPEEKQKSNKWPFVWILLCFCGLFGIGEFYDKVCPKHLKKDKIEYKLEELGGS